MIQIMTTVRSCFSFGCWVRRMESHKSEYVLWVSGSLEAISSECREDALAWEVGERDELVR